MELLEINRHAALVSVLFCYNEATVNWLRLAGY